MLRNIDLSEISDGRLYTSNDMVRAGCHGCEGCHVCCTGMGNSLVLDPADIYALTGGLQRSFESLLEDAVVLHVVDGLILPNIKMEGSKEQCCFLNEEGRCSVHAFRPGICRLFPLGRIYENESFKYFLQIHECPKPNKTKVRIRQWLGIGDLEAYERFVNLWHHFLVSVREMLEASDDDTVVKNVSLMILKVFYVQPYDMSHSFEDQFDQRLSRICGMLGIAAEF